MSNLSNIISSQVNKHNVFRTLFFIMQKLILQHVIFFGRFASPDGSSQRSISDLTLSSRKINRKKKK